MKKNIPCTFVQHVLTVYSSKHIQWGKQMCRKLKKKCLKILPPPSLYYIYILKLMCILSILIVSPMCYILRILYLKGAYALKSCDFHYCSMFKSTFVMYIVVEDRVFLVWKSGHCGTLHTLGNEDSEYSEILVNLCSCELESIQLSSIWLFRSFTYWHHWGHILLTSSLPVLKH